MCQDANPHVGDRIQPYRSDGESLVSHNFTRNRGKDREIGNCANGFLEEATGDFGLESKAGKKKNKKQKEQRGNSGQRNCKGLGARKETRVRFRGVSV